MKKIYLLFMSIMLGLCGNALAKTTEFEEIQKEINDQKYRKPIETFFAERNQLDFAPKSGSTLKLIEYKLFDHQDSKKPRVFAVVTYDLNMEKFEQEAAQIRKMEPSNVKIVLPQSIMSLIVVIDHDAGLVYPLAAGNGKFNITASFAKLWKDNREFIFIKEEPTDKEYGDMRDYGRVERRILVFRYDSSEMRYRMLKMFSIYIVTGGDSPDGSLYYLDRSEISFSDWIEGKYREIVFNTDRKILEATGGFTGEFSKRKQTYGWINKETLFLAEQVYDDKIVLNRGDALKLYNVEVLAKKPIQDNGPELVEYIGDAHDDIVFAARNAILTNLGKLINQRTSFEKPTLQALIKKIDKGNKKEKEMAIEILYLLRTDIGKFNFTSGEMKILYSAIDEKAPDNTLLNLLAFAGEEKILPLLVNQLEKAVMVGDGCKASNIVTGFRYLSHKKPKLSQKHRATLEKYVNTTLGCGCSEETIGDDIRRILDEFK